MYTADFNITNDWGTGFTGEIVITNLGNESIEWSRLEFDAPFAITNLWNGELLSDEGGSYVVTNAAWNSTIGAGSSITIGFNGRKSSSAIAELTNLNFGNLGRPVGSSAPPLKPEIPASVTPKNDDVAPAPAPAIPAPAAPAPAAPAPDLTSAAPILTPPAPDLTSAAPVPTSSGPALNGAVKFEVTKDWGDGFTANVTIRNNGNGVIDGWALGLEAPFTVQQIWNASSTAAAGGTINFAPLSWNQTIAADGTLTFGFVGAKNSNADPTPTRYSFNGAAVSLPAAPLPTLPALDIVDGVASPPDVVASPDPVPAPSPVPNPTPNAGLPSSGPFNYAEALQKSFLFYEAQRSGPLPDDNRIEWRGDSALSDGADVGLDLSGGYYDAGDHVKFGLPMAYSMTMLSWGVGEYRDAYTQIGQIDEALDAIKWGTDFILKAHVTDANGTKEFWGQVGDGNSDHSYWGAPEDMAMERPAFKIDRQNPGSDLAAEAAAALAAASIVFRPTDSAYADTLLSNAEQLYDFADTYRGKYSDAIPNAQNFYNSWSGYEDELAWGASWLYEATGNVSYLQQAESVYQDQLGGLEQGWTINWDDKSYGAAVLLAQQTNSDRYQQDVEGWLNSWVEGRNGVQITDGGLRWISQWGSLRYAANTAFVAGVYADTVRDPKGEFGSLAETTTDYLLGNNPRNSSYVVGFGENSPLQPHHRASHGGTWGDFNSASPNENILYGALVGGPDKPNDFAYEDSRGNYITNEVALDYNAGLTGSLARMASVFGGTPLSTTELNALPGVAVVNII